MSELDLGPRSFAGVGDPELERGREPRGALVDRGRCECGVGRTEVVVDPALDPATGAASVKWWASSAMTRSRSVRCTRSSASPTRRWSSARRDAGDPVVDRAAHELVREAARAAQAPEAPRRARCGSPRDGARKSVPVEPAASASTRELESRPGDGRELERRTPSPGRGARGAAARCRRSRSGPRSSASGPRKRTPSSETSTRAVSRSSRQSSQRSSGVPPVSSPISTRARRTLPRRSRRG